MRYSTILASAISATAVLAAPVDKRDIVTSWVIDIVTEYTTVYPTSTPVPAVQPSAPVALGQGGSGSYHSGGWKHSSPAPAPTSTYVPPPPPVTTTAQAVEPTTTAASGSSGSSGSTTAGTCSPFSNSDFSTNSALVDCGVSVVDTFNKWRSWYNLGSLTWDSDLAAAAWNTVYNDEGGPAMNHDLTHGSMAEIITPGFWDLSTLDASTQGDVPSGFTPFDLAMAGWLCEVPSDSQLQASGPTGHNLCGNSGTVGQVTHVTGTDSSDPTGHHDIIVTPGYTKMACAYMTSTTYDGNNPYWAGQWVCEFA